MPVTIGVQIQPQHCSMEAMKEAVLEVESLGADAIYTWDHFYPLYGDPDGRHYEGISTLAMIAAITTKPDVGILVACNSYRNPELLADAHRTIDHISGGRTILGIGAGWFEKDYDEYGYEFGEAPDRLRALGAALPRIEKRLGRLNPPPVNGTLPIMIGGAGPKVTLKLVAKHAQWWHSFGSPRVYQQKAGILAEHCEREGRDPSEIKRAWGTHSFDDLLAHADEFADLGVDQLIVGIGGDGERYDLAQVRQLIEWRDARG